ncbi:MAG: hypothetical protein R3192_04205 [Woeseiaceae bacterium]|nr:hypothetical protein [Woeseiaceae bacterium]
MKRQILKTLRRLAVTAVAAILAVASPLTAFAENNTGTGDVAGDTNALADSNVFQLFSTGAGLALVKTAFMTSDGSPIATGSTVPQGTNVDFMIYVNNLGSVDINDISIQDVLDPLFVYQAGTIRIDNSVANCAAAACTPAEEAAIYAAASAAGANTDGVDGDTSSFAGVTVDAGDQSVGNLQLDVAANTVLAMVFTVQVQ